MLGREAKAEVIHMGQEATERHSSGGLGKTTFFVTPTLSLEIQVIKNLGNTIILYATIRMA